jgi:hypothetical protein
MKRLQRQRQDLFPLGFLRWSKNCRCAWLIWRINRRSTLQLFTHV